MFDPYEKWLGISKEQRPVDYFQLLGLDPKEKDPQAIRSAAQRRVDQLSGHKESAHAQACTRLLKEIRQAQTILLDPAKRKEYLTQLPKMAAEKTGSGAVEEESTPSKEKATSGSSKRAAGKGSMKRTGKSTKKSSSSRQSGRTWLWLTLGGVAALLLVGGIVTFWLTRPKKDNAPASPQPVANLTQPQPVVPPPAAARPPDQTVGKHLCFFHERWDEGLPLLAKGGVDEAVALARKDLTPPADEKAQIAVGDGWWLLGNRAKEWDKRSLHNRAVAWYELVQPTTTGEEKTTMMKRMEEAFAVAPRITRLLPGSFYGRGVEDRILLLREGGGTMQSEEAVALGLRWLALHQSVSG